MQAKPYLQKIILQRDKIPDADVYPFNIPALKDLDFLELHADVTFLVSENGTGKSTLIEAIALALGFSIEGGSKNVQISSHDNASHLSRYIQTIKSHRRPRDHYFLRSESFYNVATYMEEISDPAEFYEYFGVTSLHGCSHGEAFMTILSKKLKGDGLYVFDEPEAALSPTRQLSALRLIDKLVKNGSQFIIATHSPILLSYPNSTIYQLTESGIDKVDLEDTEHFAVTKYFLNNYQKMLQEILQ